MYRNGNANLLGDGNSNANRPVDGNGNANLPVDGNSNANSLLQDIADQVRTEFDANQRPCLACHTYIQRTEGCNYMICQCGNAFCFNCGTEMPKGNGINRCTDHAPCDRQAFESEVIAYRVRTRLGSPTNRRDEIRIHVEYKESAHFALSIRPTITQLELKRKMSAVSGIPVDRLRLTIAGRPAIGDDTPVNELGLRRNGTVVINVTTAGGNLMQMII
jgi:hypothetical protein